MKSIAYSLADWEDIQNKIRQDYPPSVTLIRSKMKRVLGFTVREHREFVAKMDGGYSNTTIHLDFYNEKYKTLFLLRYGDYESSRSNTF
jgi:hypothetical protein